MERWIEQEKGEQQLSFFPLVPLRAVLTERRESLSLKGDLADWQAITIKFSGDVIPRERDQVFKGTMFAAYAGDLVFSKIDARNGAVGLIPATMPKTVVTTEYPVLIPDSSRLRTDFLHHLLRADHFKTALHRQASGTSGRKRITAEIFLNLEIPLPTLAKQDELLAAYSSALAEAATLEAEAERIETEARCAFETALGVALPPPMPDRPVFIARFKDFERWSHEGMLRGAPDHRSIQPAVWPMVTIGEIGKVTYGIQKCPANRPSTHPRPYLRVANVQRDVLDLREIKYINVPDKELPKLRLEPGDVLLCEGNSADLVGRGAIWKGEIEDCVHQNHILRVRFDKTAVLSEFVLAIINSSFGQSYFRSKAKRTTNLASINSREVSTMPLPLPPLAEQQRLVGELEQAGKETIKLRKDAKDKRQSAWAAFESALFESKTS